MAKKLLFTLLIQLLLSTFVYGQKNVPIPCGNNAQCSVNVQGTGTGSKGLTQIGGGFDFKAPKYEINFNADHNKGQGTDISVKGQANLWTSKNGKTKIDGTGSFNQHLGGPGGNGKPQFGGGIKLIHKFR